MGNKVDEPDGILDGREEALDGEGLDDVMDMEPRDTNASKDDSGDPQDGQEEEPVEEEEEEEDGEGGDEEFEDGEGDEGAEEEDGDDDEEGGEESEEEPSKGDTVTLTVEEHAALLSQINDLAGEKTKEIDLTKVPKREDLEADEPNLDLPEGEVFFKDEEALDEVLTDVKSANEFFGNVLKKGQEQVLRSLPTLVGKMIEKRTVLQSAALAFYKGNEDLRPYGKLVELVTTQLASEDPNKPIDELLGDVAVEVRTRLNLKKKAIKKKSNSNKSGVHKKKSRSRKSKVGPKMTDLEKEVNDLM